MAFFDEGDEPRTRVDRPRRPAGARPAGGGGGGGGARGGGGGSSADTQTLRNRRIVAGVIAALSAVLLFVLIDGCLDSRAKNALRDYNRDVASIIRQSDRDVGRPFFELMNGGGGTPVELESQISELRNTAEKQVDRARDFSVPDDMRTPQRNLLLALNMRAGGLEKIASEVRTALAEDGGDATGQAVDQIAAQMQQFVASDVTYNSWVRPYIEQELEEKEITGQEIASTQFIPNLEWVDPGVIGERLGAEGGGSRRGNEPPAPGLHGHGLTSVTVGDLTLEPGETANRIPAGSNVTFDVAFQNQGENEETDVPVRVRIRGDGANITATKRIETTEAGAEAEIAVPLPEAPPIGTPVTIEVTVEKVPGEEKTDNNTQEYTAIFTR